LRLEVQGTVTRHYFVSVGKMTRQRKAKSPDAPKRRRGRTRKNDHIGKLAEQVRSGAPTLDRAGRECEAAEVGGAQAQAGGAARDQWTQVNRRDVEATARPLRREGGRLRLLAWPE
jgi:hypothetical protein